MIVYLVLIETIEGVKIGPIYATLREVEAEVERLRASSSFIDAWAVERELELPQASASQ